MGQKKALETDLNSHVNKDPRAVHGIWDLIRDYIPVYVALSAPQSISITADNTWRDVDLSAYVPSTVFMVKLLLVQTDGGASPRWIMGYFRANGNSSANGQTDAQYNVETVDGNKISAWSEERDCPMVDQTLEYKIYKDAGTVTLYLLGYWQKGV